MGEASGLKTAVVAAREVVEDDLGAEPEQLDMLGLPPRRDIGQPLAPRGRGRPPGARNRRTQEWTSYLLSRHGSPLDVLAQIAEARVEDLVLTLGCSPLEALQEKRHAAVALAPYLHQRQAIAVDVTSKSVVHLSLDLGSAGELEPAPSIADLVLEAEVIEIQQNQGLAAIEPEKSDSGKSDSDV